MENITIVIQAGGQSSRMGRDKGLVLLDRSPLIEHVLAALLPLPGERAITTNNPEAYAYLGLRLCQDPMSGLGAAYGLQTACRCAQTPLLMLVACDMPFADPALLHHQVERLGRAEAVVPEWNGRLQPFHAVYRRRPLLAAVERGLAVDRFSLHQIIGDLDLEILGQKELDAFTRDGRPFFNINTPADLEAAEAIIAASGRKGSGRRP